MSDISSEQDDGRWKQKYYAHLDLLDQKEKDWKALESILKKAVLRLSLAAEGQHVSIDNYLHDISSEVKGRVNAIKLENLPGNVSALLLKTGGKLRLTGNYRGNNFRTGE